MGIILEDNSMQNNHGKETEKVNYKSIKNEFTTKKKKNKTIHFK